jgi:membrane protease subunit (stomatin/prohibitin family)
MSKENKMITLDQEHIDVVESKALNLSKYVRNKLEEDFPQEFNE